MKTAPIYTIALIVLGILAYIWKSRSEEAPVDEIVLDGIHVPRKPCLSAMNEIYGTGIDSGRLCDCLIPEFYNLIKSDSAALARFKEVGVHTLEGEKNQMAGTLFNNCVKNSVLDSSHRLALSIFFKGNAFAEKLKNSLGTASIPGLNIDSFANCLTERLNGYLTIKEYLSEDFTKVERIDSAMKLCRVNATK